MAAYFQLISKITHKATSFNQIDEEICVQFGWPVDAEKYAYGWYDSIGWRVATGKTFDEIRTEYINEIIEAIILNNEITAKRVQYYTAMVGIVNFLSCRYSTDAWYGR